MKKNYRENYRYAATGQRTLKISGCCDGYRPSERWVRYLPTLEIRCHKTKTGNDSRQVVGIGETQIWQGDIAGFQLRFSGCGLNGHRLLELNESGLLISREDYYPFGGTARWATRSQCSACFKTLRYGGKERDLTGLIYYGFRYYLPWRFRWLNPDPAGEIDGLNLWRMCRNNPVSGGDEDGRMFTQNPGQSSASYVDPLAGAPEADAAALDNEVRKLAIALGANPLLNQQDTFPPATSTVTSPDNILQNLPPVQLGQLPLVHYPQPESSALPMNYTCNLCGLSYPRLEELMAHREGCQPPANFLCIECGTRFHFEEVLAAHRAKYHPAVLYPCGISGCPSTFPSREAAAEHMARANHQKIKRYRCEQCNKRFHRPDDLEKHIEAHSRSRNFTCDFPGCELSFFDRNYLKQHKATHSGVGFKCSYANCEFSSAYRNNLTRHMKRAHGYETRRGGKRS